jgi:GxxExxY protein
MGDALTGAIIGAAIEVHRILGPGLLESIYEEALSYELNVLGMAHTRQVAVGVCYKNRILLGQRIDLLVEGQVIVEVKSLRNVPDLASAQVLSYLRATQLKRALLINFGQRKLSSGIKRFSL